MNGTLNLLQTYEDNTFWENFISTPIEEINKSHTEIEQFIKYLKQSIDNIPETESNWDKVYFPFKKVVKTLNFLECSVSVMKDMRGLTQENPQNRKNVRLKEKIFSHLKEIESDEKLISLFKKFKRQFKAQNKEKIISAWLENFFLVNLSAEEKKQQTNLTKRLDKKIELFTQNSEKALWNQNYAIYINEDKGHLLDGLPYFLVRTGRSNAFHHHSSKQGWLFYAEENTCSLIIAHARSRELRKKAYEAHERLNSGDRVLMNNDLVLKDIISIKQKIARIHKKENYSQLVLSNYVLNTTEKAYGYLMGIEEQLSPLIDNVQADIKNIALKDGIYKLKNWDIPYYYEKIKRLHNSYKDNTFKHFFTYEKTMEKLIPFFNKQLDISMKKVECVWSSTQNELHKYELIDNKTSKRGFILVSPFANEVKSGGSQIELLSHEMIGGFETPAIEYINLTFNRDNTAGKTFLSFTDVYILLHELGHALHAFFGDKKDSILNTSLISWDLIELPSQFLEHLAYNKKFMQQISCHYQTGEKIKVEHLKEVIEREQYFQGYETFQNIKKYYAQLWLHENFKINSKKSPHQIVNEKMGNEGILYNIARDGYMLYNDHMTDYAPAGYIYLYSAQIAFQLFAFCMDNKIDSKPGSLRNIFANIFNSCKMESLEERLSSLVDLTSIDMLKFFKKTWNIEIYGAQGLENKENKLKEAILRKK